MSLNEIIRYFEKGYTNLPGLFLTTESGDHPESKVFYLQKGDEGYGSGVLEMDSGKISVEVPRDMMVALIEETVREGKGRLELITDIEDRLGSPGSSEGYEWYENNVKQYKGRAIIYLEITDGKPEFKFELPEHNKHKWGGW